MNILKKGYLTEAEIHRWLRALRKKAHVPESGYAVAAVFRARAGEAEDYYFAGVNVENVDHRLSTHGEEGAISALVTALGKQAHIVEGWVMGAAGGKHAEPSPPASCCGKCRQQIAGLAAKGTKIHYMPLTGKMKTTTVEKFLPDPFTFRTVAAGFSKDLNDGKAPAAAALRKKLLRQGPLGQKEIAIWLRSLESVDYATGISQSMVLKLDNGYYAAGTRVEEAAFVDINAAQAATAIATAAFGACKVEGVWVYTQGRGDKKLPVRAVGILPLSALQTLAEFAKSDKIPVHYLGGKSMAVKKTLSAAAAHAPVSGREFYRA